ncbi:MAG: endonuclease/exonuclease/phosphatase family protein [Ornithinimicrobium sp.]
MRRAVGVVGAIWLFSAACLLGLRWVDGGVLVVALQCGLPMVGVSLVLLLAVAAIARRWILALATAALLVPMVVLAWPWWLQPDLEPPGEGDIVVLASNLLFGNGDIGMVDQQVRGLDVDALVLLEITPQALQRVEASGIPDALPHRSGAARADAGGTMVFTAAPHESVSDAPNLLFDQVVVQVQPQGEETEPWLLFGAHPVPPTLPQWSSDLAALHEWEQAQPPSARIVMAGDFNASSGHPAFRRLTEDLTDARRRTAPGWVRTWPRESVIPAFVQLDHVLVRGTEVIDAGQVRIPGSDHDAVWARLSP